MRNVEMKDTGNNILPEDELITISVEDLINLFVDFIPLIILIQIVEQYHCKSIGEFTLALNRCLND